MDEHEHTEPAICKPCNGRGTHITKRDHPQGAGHTVTCSSCDGTGIATPRRDEKPQGSKRPIARFG